MAETSAAAVMVLTGAAVAGVEAIRVVSNEWEPVDLFDRGEPVDCL